MDRLELTIEFCGLFEAELLAELMLRYWEHPRCADRELVNFLVESASEMLQRSSQGERFFEDINPEDVNYVSAIWYAEFCQVQELKDSDTQARRDWLLRVRRALPSCFCDPDDLISESLE